MSEDPPRRMLDEEIIALAKDAIEASREETRRSADNDGAAKDLQQPGATIDLGHKNILNFPDEVVEIIKDEIERLALSHNLLSSLPPRLAECRRLRYLNVRYNSLREFPQPVLQLSSLEILDVSKNRIKVLPDEIANLTSLKVLAIQRNKIERLPLCIGEISSLQVLKLDGNPLVFPPPDICTIKKDAPSPSNENEKDAVITPQIKRYLRQIATRERLRVESEGESSEGNVETPRPPKRMVSGRFPVKPSISGMEAFDVSRPESPAGPPPIPARSHNRGQSQQSNAVRRPMISPLILSNERNRSQSEGATSATLRTKRGGLVLNNVSELSSVDEGRPQPANHTRGYSQGSTLSGSTLSNGASAGSSISDSSQRALSGRPLSDLLEHKRRSRAPDVVVEASKTILYALAQLQDPVLHVLRNTRCYEAEDTKRGQLFAHRVHESNLVLRQLADYLRKFDTLAEEDDEDADNLSMRIRETVVQSADQYMYVVHSLCDNCQEILRDCDPRYLRTLMVLQQASLAEIRNACSVLGVEFLSDGRAPPEQDVTRLMASSAAGVFPNGRRAPLGRRYLGSGSKASPSNEIAINGMDSSRVNTMTSLGTATPRSGESFSALASRPDQYSTMEDLEEAQFEKVYLKLRSAMAYTQDNLTPCRHHFMKVKQAAEADFDPTDARIRTLANLVQKTDVVLDVTRRLAQRLSTIKLRDPVARNQQDFWSLCHTYAKVWTDLAQSMSDVSRLGAVTDDIRKAMRMIHKAVKEVTLVINSSPWSHLAVSFVSPTPMGTINSVIASNLQTQPNTAIPPPSISPASSMPQSTLPSVRGLGLPNSASTTNLVAAAANSMPQPINTSIASSLSSLRAGLDSALSASSSSLSLSSMGSSTTGYTTPVPPTPLSAALGAAAQATVPSTPAGAPNGAGLTIMPGGSLHPMGIGGTMAAGGAGSTGGISANTVFERADQLLRNPQRRV